MLPRWYFATYFVMLTAAMSISAHAATLQISMENIAFSPADVTATVGDTIEWINKDIFVHTATARNGDWDVNIGAMKTVLMGLKKTGSVEYYCRFHPNMTGKITIIPP